MKLENSIEYSYVHGTYYITSDGPMTLRQRLNVPGVLPSHLPNFYAHPREYKCAKQPPAEMSYREALDRLAEWSSWQPEYGIDPKKVAAAQATLSSFEEYLKQHKDVLALDKYVEKVCVDRLLKLRTNLIKAQNTQAVLNCRPHEPPYCFEITLEMADAIYGVLKEHVDRIYSLTTHLHADHIKYTGSGFSNTDPRYIRGEMHPNQNLLTLDIGIVEPHQNAEGKWRTQLVWSEVFRGQIKQ